MSIFAYKAKKGPHDIIEATIEAETKDIAIAKIDQMGYVPIRVVLKKASSLDAAKQLPADKSSATATALGLFARIRPKDLTTFTEQLASLVKSKITLFEAINILATQTENILLRRVISDISDDLKDGKNLTESMSKHPNVFPALYINMIRSGESGGVLADTLKRLAKFRQDEEERRAKISAALAYPIFIIIVGLLTVFFLLTFAIPRLVSLFADLGQSLPWPTQLLISTSAAIRGYWYWILLVIVALIFFFKRTQESQRLAFDRLRFKIPVLGNFQKNEILAIFSRTFATLIANGIPVFQALQITIPTANNEIFKRELEKIHTDIIAGSSFAQSVKKSVWFPSFMINMITVAEKGGDLKEALLESANFYEREVNKTLKIITSLLEPIIILVMGLIVGFIVFAMLLPIFQVNIGMG